MPEHTSEFMDHLTLAENLMVSISDQLPGDAGSAGVRALLWKLLLFWTDAARIVCIEITPATNFG